MIVTQHSRLRAQDELRGFYARHGVPQIRADVLGVDADNLGWVKFARCGQWNTDAPDPEIFYATAADSPDTYAAQQFCRDCPVRDLCDATADRYQYPGVWGGIYRGPSGMPELLCKTALCMNYRRVSYRYTYDLCQSCQTVADQAAEREAARAEREAARAEAARATVARTPGGKRATGRPVGRPRKTADASQADGTTTREVVAA